MILSPHEPDERSQADEDHGEDHFRSMVLALGVFAHL